MSEKYNTQRQPEPKENPEHILVKEGESSKRAKELLFQPVTFSKSTLESDQNRLNDALNCGFEIVDAIKTDTGIVYVLSKNAIHVGRTDTPNNANIRESLREIYTKRSKR